MNYRQLIPRTEHHTNRNFLGIRSQGIQDCPATAYTVPEGRAIAMSYRASFLERFLFLFSGQIYVSIFGDAVPPTAVGLGHLFPKEGKK